MSLRSLICRLNKTHQTFRASAGGRLYLTCPACGWESPGWTLGEIPDVGHTGQDTTANLHAEAPRLAAVETVPAVPVEG